MKEVDDVVRRPVALRLMTSKHGALPPAVDIPLARLPARQPPALPVLLLRRQPAACEIGGVSCGKPVAPTFPQCRVARPAGLSSWLASSTATMRQSGSPSSAPARAAPLGPAVGSPGACVGCISLARRSPRLSRRWPGAVPSPLPAPERPAAARSADHGQGEYCRRWRPCRSRFKSVPLSRRIVSSTRDALSCRFPLSSSATCGMHRACRSFPRPTTIASFSRPLECGRGCLRAFLITVPACRSTRRRSRLHSRVDRFLAVFQKFGVPAHGAGSVRRMASRV